MEQNTIYVSLNDINTHTFRLLVPVLLCKENKSAISTIIFVLFV